MTESTQGLEVLMGSLEEKKEEPSAFANQEMEEAAAEKTHNHMGEWYCRTTTVWATIKDKKKKRELQHQPIHLYARPIRSLCASVFRPP